MTGPAHREVPARPAGSRFGTATLAVCAATLAACAEGPAGPALFQKLDPSESGIGFVNELPDDPTFNIINYLNYYNGGGVAAGDVDGDGLPDLYFTSNRDENRLYLNRGGLRFEDVTASAGVAGGEGWTTGATMADVNGDGHLDLYVSAVTYLGMQGRNILYLNDGDGTFTDRTEAFGLGHIGYGTQAAFFDYDLDGDLDAYLLNHSVHAERGNSFSPQRDALHPRSGDRLLRNDGGRFTDVTAGSGIYSGVEGYGLGVVVSDLDLDGCPDIYVANDFQENDFLYYNECDGTFTEAGQEALGHTSLSSMGVDAADFDGDARPDIVVLDMLPEREDILKSSANAEVFEIERRKLMAGYGPQYARNTLQLNRGGRRFSEIGYLAGVHATDWSWAPLFADYDNDGDKDLFVTNGIYRRSNDLDYLAYVARPTVQQSLADGIGEEDLPLLERMPRVPIPNYAFRNDGGLRFTDAAGPWGLGEPGFSNGAAWADLDADGALDLVVNHLNAPSAVYRNRARELMPERRYLAIELEGAGGNTNGVGTKVLVRHGASRQFLEQMPTRGFQSSVEPRLHFGLGEAARVDSLLVIWPDRRYQTLTDVPADTTLTLRQTDAAGQWVYGGLDAAGPAIPAASVAPPDPPRFVDVTASTGIDFTHRENPFFDYRTQPLIPHQLSTEGPPLAVGDVDGDGRDDLFIGGAKYQAGRLYLQRTGGRFGAARVPAFRADSLHEDTDAALFDADGDGNLDLYVVSGGNEFWGEHEALRDRLYLGDGAGGFTRSSGRLPDLFENGACAVPGDFDADGDVDLFVGTRVIAREYGRTPRSALLENDGTGRFTDVTEERAEGLAEIGMVASAAWLDEDGDGRLDLAVVGEWMPVRLFRQEGGRFVDRAAAAGLEGTSGWWNLVVAADLTGDGRDDLVLGNLGLNSYLRATPERPARMYVRDFGRDGTLDQILTTWRDGASYPLVGRNELVSAMPELRGRFPTYADFGASGPEDLLPAAALEEAEVLTARTFESAVAVARGDGMYELVPLPVEAQFAPLYAALADDMDGDGAADLLTAGNLHGVPPVRGRYDADYGVFLRGDGGGGFRAVDAAAVGLWIDGQVRDLAFLDGAGGRRLIAVARNDAPLQILSLEP